MDIEDATEACGLRRRGVAALKRNRAGQHMMAAERVAAHRALRHRAALDGQDRVLRGSFPLDPRGGAVFGPELDDGIECKQYDQQQRICRKHGRARRGNDDV